jgi:hypothetical protein
VASGYQHKITHYSERVTSCHKPIITGYMQVGAPLLRTLDERQASVSSLYKVVMDASDLGLGAVLLQEGPPVASVSWKLNSAELLQS